MKNTFLVTGATGFIGANAVRRLVKDGQHVVIVARDKKVNERLSDIAKMLDIYECDLLDTRISKIVSEIKPDYIFHFAVYGGFPHQDNVDKMMDVNFRGTINLLQAAKKNPFKLFINTGTAAEYGVKKEPMKEEDLLAPISDYGVIKSAVTLYCQKEAAKNNLPIISFRLFTPYGYFEDKSRLIPSVITSALKSQPIKVSTPYSVRDFIFIDDVIEAYLQACRATIANGEIFNIGLGKQHCIGDIVNMIVKITKSKSDIHWGAVSKQQRFIEPVIWQADISKAKQMLGWEPKNSIESGLQKTIQWFTENNR